MQKEKQRAFVGKVFQVYVWPEQSFPRSRLLLPCGYIQATRRHLGPGLEQYLLSLRSGFLRPSLSNSLFMSGSNLLESVKIVEICVHTILSLLPRPLKSKIRLGPLPLAIHCKERSDDEIA
jgi:hypothetical protein